MGLPAIFVLLILGASGVADPEVRIEMSRGLMGTDFRIVLYAADRTTGEAAATAALECVAQLERTLSDYDAESALSRLSESAGTGTWQPVGPDLWAALETAQAWSERSDGAFDVTVGPLTRLWRWASRRGVLPPEDRLEEARRAVGYRYLHLDAGRRSVLLEKPGMRLDVGGLGKGLAADRALAVLREHGVTRALIDAGGDLVIGEPPPGQEGWQVEVGGRVRTLSHVAVATSGATHRATEADGHRFSHVIDPRSGLGVTDPRRVVATAGTGADADALASAASVLGPEASARLAKVLPGAHVQFVEEDQHGDLDPLEGKVGGR
jgi:thiamine biosynthesis lipoprotein